jgi:feruloyl-CoA synthase
MGGAARDAVVCGEGQSSIGLLIFRNQGFAGDSGAAIRSGLAQLNAGAKGGGKVARALILADQPDPVSGEITDKGYINQTKARQRRRPDIARLFASRPDADIIILEA